MRLSLFLRGHKHFGNLGKTYGEYKFAISPNEQHVWRGFLKQAIVNPFKEYVWRSWWMYTPPIVFYYLLYDWAKKENYRLNRKDPYEYINDE